MLGQRLAGRDAAAQPVGPGPFPISGCASSAAYSVGTPAKIVGRCARIVASTASGVGRSGSSTEAAPTVIGNVIELPSP